MCHCDLIGIRAAKAANKEPGQVIHANVESILEVTDKLRIGSFQIFVEVQVGLLRVMCDYIIEGC